MKLKILIMTILITTGAANARSAEIEILARENLEAERYKNQIQEQSRAVDSLLDHARRLARKSKTAYTDAVKREAEYTALIASEQRVADSKVYLKEYNHTNYDYLPSGKETEAKLIGVNK